MNEQNAFELADLIARYIKDELSFAEESVLMDLLESDKENYQLLEYYKNTAVNQESIDYMSGLDVSKAWQKVVEKKIKGEKMHKSISWSWLRYAAVLFIMISIGGWWIHYNNKPIEKSSLSQKHDILPGTEKATLLLSDGTEMELSAGSRTMKERDGTQLTSSSGELSYMAGSTELEKSATLYNTLKVPKAGTYSVVLPDGSRVWLNALSSLRFPLSFDKNERKVFLEGEAYFEIKKNTVQPFKVMVKGQEVKVLGTAFNISAYGSHTVTTLFHGAVKVKSGNQESLLSPGQEALMYKDRIDIRTADLSRATAWKEGYFYFNEDKIQDIMEQLSRWYDVDIYYEGKISDQHFGGTMNRNIKLNEALEMLKDISQLNFELQGRKLIVKTNKPK